MRHAENIAKWREVFEPVFTEAKKVSMAAVEWHDEDRDCENGLLVYYICGRYTIVWLGEGWGSRDHCHSFETWIEKFYKERSDDETQADYGPLYVKWSSDMTDVWSILREVSYLEELLDL